MESKGYEISALDFHEWLEDKLAEKGRNACCIDAGHPDFAAIQHPLAQFLQEKTGVDGSSDNEKIAIGWQDSDDEPDEETKYCVMVINECTGKIAENFGRVPWWAAVYIDTLRDNWIISWGTVYACFTASQCIVGDLGTDPNKYDYNIYQGTMAS
jgi:hypothetical protein